MSLLHISIVNRIRALTLAAALALAACAGSPPNQQIASKAQAIQPALIAACNTAMTLAPLAGPYAQFIVAGCGTTEAVDKLAADPSSTQWVNGIVASVQALRGKA